MKELQPILALGDDEIHVWTVHLDAPALCETDWNSSMLAPSERERASRFHFERDRLRFTRHRIALRTILGRYLGVSPSEIAYTENSFGKPSIAEPLASAGVTFNASHSQTVALVAVSRSTRLGVDIEYLRPVHDADRIAARYFTNGEAAALAALDARRKIEGFFSAWTRKEAVVKALGGGLSIPLDSFEVTLRPGAPAAIAAWKVPGEEPSQWRIHHLTPVPGYIGCLAADREVGVHECRFEAM